jgi:hypothetical protein
MPVFVRDSVKVTAHDVKARHLDYQSLRVDEAGLWLEGKLALPRDEITATSLELDERTTVRVQGKKNSGFSCTFTDRQTAHELLVALGREPDRVAAMVSLEPSLLTMGFHPLPLWKALASVVTAIVVMVALLPFVARAGSFSSFGRLGRFVNRTLELGTDGLRIRTVGGDEFVAYREITKAEARGEVLHLVMRDGRECALPLTSPGRATEVIARIAQSIGVSEPIADAAAATLLREVVGDRAGRVTALRELAAENAGTYREARLPRERLWQLLEDPHVDARSRVRSNLATASDCASRPTRR